MEAENIPKSHGKPLPAWRGKHGAKSVHLRLRYSDGRSREGRFLRSVHDDLLRDLGGPENVTSGQRLLLGRIVEKVRVLKCIGDYVDRQTSIVLPDGEILACLGKNYISYAESLRRDLQAVFDMATKRPSRAPSLDDYLKQAKTVEHSETKS